MRGADCRLLSAAFFTPRPLQHEALCPAGLHFPTAQLADVVRLLSFPFPRRQIVWIYFNITSVA